MKECAADPQLREVLMLGSLGSWEILLVAVIVIVLFGAKRIPALMKGLGEGIRGFKKGLAGEPESDDSKITKKPG